MHVGISYGDPNGGLHGAVAVLAALLHRATTGEGQFIDLSQQETSIAGARRRRRRAGDHRRAAAPQWQPRAIMAPHGVYRCAGDQRWVAIAVRDDAEWRRCATAMGRPDLAADARFATLADRKANEDVLDALITEWTIARPPEEFVAGLQRAGVPTSLLDEQPGSRRGPSTSPRAASFVHSPHPEVGTRLHLGCPGACPTRRAPSATPPRSSASIPTTSSRRVLGYPPSASPLCASAACWGSGRSNYATKLRDQ
jgi:crotonobetainyl-CoA:carnitine CoA-transferase CaiB-like acyl-CoA transferase